MSFINTYSPPKAIHSEDPYGPDPWDLNFPFPIPPAIENSVVKLVPFIPRLHADAFYDVAGGSDMDLYHFIRRPFRTKEAFLAFLVGYQRNPECMTFLIVDKTKPELKAEGEGLGGRMAGMFSFMTTNAENRYTEIGFIIVLKSAQRSHVTTNAVGLLMQYVLNTPEDPIFPGLGLRRVQWTCDSGNLPSLATAKRLGFQLEGTLRWLWVIPETSTSGNKPREGDVVKGNGRHDIFLSMCWDDWMNGGRETLETQMARRS